MDGQRRAFVFLVRLTGRLAGPMVARAEAGTMIDVAERLPGEDPSATLTHRRLSEAELERWTRAVELPEAPFLGPVFGGFEVELCPDEHGAHASVLEALADAARAASGTVIRVADGELRHAVERVRFAAEELVAAPCFGEGRLLCLPHDARYEAHVRQAVAQTLARADLSLNYVYSMGGGEHVKLCFERGVGRCWGPGPSSLAERLRGHRLEVFAEAPWLESDRAFWRGEAGAASG